MSSVPSSVQAAVHHLGRQRQLGTRQSLFAQNTLGLKNNVFAGHCSPRENAGIELFLGNCEPALAGRVSLS